MRGNINPRVWAAVLAALLPSFAGATPPPSPGGRAAAVPQIEDIRTRAIESYVVQRGLRDRAEAVARQRSSATRDSSFVELAAPMVGPGVSGNIEVPVLLATFNDTGAPPFDPGILRKQLFDGPWPSGTMAEHYKEMSRGKLTVLGQVSAWTQMPADGRFYTGPSGCNGICNQSRLGDLILETLRKNDASVDFARYDNNGPDNQVGSADDDGFVDFVAFVHPQSGGECGNENIWSHRYSLRSLTGDVYRTNDTTAAGKPVLVDDYVIMPALACDQNTMVQIGVFSHEFGHAFGLPDLYDTRGPDKSSGLGGWSLMASGSWGGDGNSPQFPTHMDAWSKEYLGWVTPRRVTTDTMDVTLRPSITSGDVVMVDYSMTADPEDKKYLLLEYRSRTGFDKSLIKEGLVVTEVNNVRVQGGLINNTVNDLNMDMGVNIVEADGQRDLDNGINRADDGDPFPGSSNIQIADVSHSEKLSAAICNIVQQPDRITLDIYTSRTTCPGSIQEAAVEPAEASRGSVLVGQEIVVEGTLSNKGTNYFTDQRLVITGADGTELSVTAPAPLEAAPAAPNAPQRTLTPLSDLLNKKVILRGHIAKGEVRNEGVRDFLVVDEFDVAK